MGTVTSLVQHFKFADAVQCNSTKVLLVLVSFSEKGDRLLILYKGKTGLFLCGVVFFFFSVIKLVILLPTYFCLFFFLQALPPIVQTFRADDSPDFIEQISTRVLSSCLSSPAELSQGRWAGWDNKRPSWDELNGCLLPVTPFEHRLTLVNLGHSLSAKAFLEARPTIPIISKLLPFWAGEITPPNQSWILSFIIVF